MATPRTTTDAAVSGDPLAGMSPYERQQAREATQPVGSLKEARSILDHLDDELSELKKRRADAVRFHDLRLDLDDRLSEQSKRDIREQAEADLAGHRCRGDGAGPLLRVRPLPGGGAHQDAVAVVADPALLGELPRLEHLLLGGLQQRVEPANDGHRQDDVAVIGSVQRSPQHVIGNVPDKTDDVPVRTIVHALVPLFTYNVM